VTSRLIAPRVLRRSHFTVQIAGKQQWASTAADGTKVTGSGSWSLTLKYTRAGMRGAPAFVAGR
jgi:ribosomal protein L4